MPLERGCCDQALASKCAPCARLQVHIALQVVKLKQSAAAERTSSATMGEHGTPRRRLGKTVRCRFAATFKESCFG
jgi:hypothetical protein